MNFTKLLKLNKKAIVGAILGLLVAAGFLGPSAAKTILGWFEDAPPAATAPAESAE